MNTMTTQSAYKAAFLDGYIRKGRERAVRRLEKKEVDVHDPVKDGFTLPEELDHRIERRLRDLSPMRALATVEQTRSGNLMIPILGMKGKPGFGALRIYLGEIFAYPAAMQSMLDDSSFDVEDWLVEELAQEFARNESAAFVLGDGVNIPDGFLSEPISAANDAARPRGTLQHVATGVSGAFAATMPHRILMDLIGHLDGCYAQGASFVMNVKTLKIIGTFKDVDGNYLWRPPLSEGKASTLFGFPVVVMESMPDIAPDSLSVAFGNFQLGYIITDRMGTRVVRSHRSDESLVHFHATKRVGGGVINSDAIKLLKFSVD